MVAALVAGLLLLQLLQLVAVLVLLPRWVASKERQLTQLVHDFVTAPDDTSPSPLAILTDQLATLAAGRLWQQVESRLRAGVGAAGREDAQAVESQVAGSGPLAALAMAFLPKKAKMMLIKNPQFLGALSGLVPGSTRSPSSLGNNHQMDMKL